MFDTIPRITARTWQRDHAGHEKHQEEGVCEEEFIPTGGKFATAHRRTVLFISYCDRCKVCFVYDGIYEEE